MSTFRVNLNNTQQGKLDVDVNRVERATSLQRTVFIMGPNKVNRLLHDGETFTDSNYYKKFCYPQCTLEKALLSIVWDDGSVWSPIEAENTYPKGYELVCTAGTTYGDNQADIQGDTSSYAVFVQVTNTHATQAVKVRLNGVADAFFTLPGNSSQAFNAGDLSVTMVEIDNSASGSTDDVTVEVICSIKSVSAT